MWWNVINYKSRPFRLISVTTSNNKYRLSNGITGNALCHFPLRIVDCCHLRCAWQGLTLTIAAGGNNIPLWALWTQPFFEHGSDGSLFDGELLKPVFKAVYISFAGQTNCEVADVWKVPILRARGSRGQQVVLLPEPVTWAGTAQKLRKSLCYDEWLRTWILKWRLILGLFLSQRFLWSSAIKAEIMWWRRRSLDLIAVVIFLKLIFLLSSFTSWCLVYWSETDDVQVTV